MTEGMTTAASPACTVRLSHGFISDIEVSSSTTPPRQGSLSACWNQQQTEN